MRSPRLNDSKGLEDTATEKFSKKGKPRVKGSKKGKGEGEGTKSRVQQFDDPDDEFEQRGGLEGKKKKKKRIPKEETKMKEHQFLAVPAATKGKHNEEMEVEGSVLHTKRKSMGSPLDTSTAPLKDEEHKWEVAEDTGKKKKKLRKKQAHEEEAGEGENEPMN